MNSFEFTTPSLHKGKDKWLIRYTLTVNGKSDYRKEAGTTYPEVRATLNSKDFKVDGVFPIEIVTNGKKKYVPESGKNAYKKREQLAEKIILLLTGELEDGIDPEKSKAGYQAIAQKQLEESKEWSIEKNLEFYYKKINIYSNISERKKDSAYNLKTFFKNQFVGHFEEHNKELVNDIRLITKKHIRDYLDYYYEHPDPKIKWAYRTTNTRKGWISAFFNKLVEYEILTVNPADNILGKEADGSGRGDYEIFSKEEVGIIFKELESGKLANKRMEAFGKILYYAYIRKAEMRRIRMKHIDLPARKFRMTADISKKTNNGKKYPVLINQLLQPAIEQWIEKKGIDVTDDEALLFPNPNGFTLSKNFLDKTWNNLLDALRLEHPNLFKKKNQTIYSLKSSGVTHLFYNNKNRPDVIKFIQQQCRHQNSNTTEIYLKSLDCNIEEESNFSFFQAEH
jgi:Site-specific recombinase XerC